MPCSLGLANARCWDRAHVNKFATIDERILEVQDFAKLKFPFYEHSCCPKLTFFSFLDSIADPETCGEDPQGKSPLRLQRLSCI